MKTIRGRRKGRRSLLIVDLAVPRDFDPRCRSLDQVFLQNLDDLQQVISQSMAQRRAEIPQAEGIIATGVEQFHDWLHMISIEPTIVQLRERFEAIRQEELERIRSSVDEAQFEVLCQLTRRLVKRLLHLPSENLRRHHGVRDEEVKEILHAVLTTEVPHPRERHDQEQPAEETKEDES